MYNLPLILYSFCIITAFQYSTLRSARVVLHTRDGPLEKSKRENVARSVSLFNHTSTLYLVTYKNDYRKIHKHDISNQQQK